MDMLKPSRVASRIEAHRTANHISVRSAAKRAGISESRWRQIAKGYQQVTKEVRAPVNTPIDTLVRMALALRMSTHDFKADVDDTPEGAFVAEFSSALTLATYSNSTGPVFGGDYSDPDYLANIETWMAEMQERMEDMEERLAALEPADEDPDYSSMSAQDAKDYGLAAHEGDKHIGHDELPHEP